MMLDSGVKKIIINSMYGVCLTSSFHLYDIDCARCITRAARVTLRDWLTHNVCEYYPSQYFIKDMIDEFSTITISVGDKEYKYEFNEEITVLRNNKEMKIKAKDFNKNTDLLGID